MKRGFTLIELLVVIAIIAVLTSVALASFEQAKIKARDARRMSDLGEIENALNLYFTEHNLFPIEPSVVTITGEDDFSTTLETGGHISETPIDPFSPTYDYTYVSNSSGTTYTITFCLEGTSIASYAQGCSNTLTP